MSVFVMFYCRRLELFYNNFQLLLLLFILLQFTCSSIIIYSRTDHIFDMYKEISGLVNLSLIFFLFRMGFTWTVLCYVLIVVLYSILSFKLTEEYIMLWILSFLSLVLFSFDAYKREIFNRRVFAKLIQHKEVEKRHRNILERMLPIKV